MKIGIMSMQRIINYGSFLQAYSLKNTIEKMGHEVEFVDYTPGKVLINLEDSKSYKKSINQKIKSITKAGLKNTVGFPSLIDKVKIADEIYIEEISPLLGISKQRNTHPKLDVLIIGSDEVFNCLQPNPAVGYAKDLFGENNNAKKLISYAASFGNTTIEGLRKYGIDTEISHLLKQFQNISVRDDNSKKIVETLLGKKVEMHVDPVFLFDFTELLPKKKMGSNYIVVYAYYCRITEEEASLIKIFAKKNKKKIICLCSVQKHLNNFTIATPFEILAYIRDADYVITDTFHGTVFSIKYNKNFAVFVRKGNESIYGNSEKMKGLLNLFDLLSRIIEGNNTLNNVLSKKLEYSMINHKIRDEQIRSIEYIETSLESL